MGKISQLIYSIGTVAGITAMIGFYNESLGWFILSTVLTILNLFFAVSEVSE